MKAARKIIAPLAGAALLVALVVAASFWAFGQIEEGAGARKHTNAVIHRSDALMSELRDAETGQRGFLLTGLESFLEPYNLALTLLPGDLATLRRLAVHPDQQRNLDTLGPVTTQRLDELAQTLALKRAGQADAAAEIVRSGRGKLLMDRLRAVIAEMNTVEERLLEERTKDWQDSVTWSTYVTFGGSEVLLCAVMWIAWLASRDFRAREAEAWLRRAVDQGEPAGQEALKALLAEDRNRERTLDLRALEARFRSAAEKRPLRSALPSISLEDRHHEGHGSSEEARWFARAAEKGNPVALRNLGLFFLSGEGVKPDDAEGYKRLLAAAQKKDVEAQWTVGVLLLSGRGVAKDEASAAGWFKAAADAGDLLARRALGRMKETGRGVSVDLKEAAKLYRLAADAGDAWSRTALGRMNEDGRGMPRNLKEARTLYEAAGDFPPALVDLGLLQEAAGEFIQAHTSFSKAVEKGDDAARYHLGALFEMGRGGLVDLAEAARLYDVAAFGGVAEAQVRRARLLEIGRSGKPDEAKAASYYGEVAAGGRQPLAALALGLMRWEGRGGKKDAVAAEDVWKPLADAGDPLAAFWYGRAAEKSGGDAVAFYRTAARGGEVRAEARLAVLLEKQNPKESLTWLAKAAEGGDAASAALLARKAAGTKEAMPALRRAARLGDRDSQAEFARRILDGESALAGSAEAARWFHMAAVQDDPSSQHALANLYLAGEGVGLDPAEAARWLTRAAGRGFVPAQRDLAMLYEQGLGVKKDPAKAAEWYKKAAAGGDAFAKKKIGK